MQRVKKPWGYEIIFADTEFYVGKILHIEKGEQLSLQYHEVKDETVYVATGVLELELQEGEELVAHSLGPGEARRIVPGTKNTIEWVPTTQDVVSSSTPPRSWL